MRRFYVTGYEVWNGDHQFSSGVVLPRWNLFSVPGVGSHCLHLINYTSQDNAELVCADPAAWEQLPEVQAWRAAGALMLISADFATEEHEAAWHAIPQVAHLPHPKNEGHVMLKMLRLDPGHSSKNFKKAHLDGLSIIGVKGTHTVWDVHRIASAICPTVRLGNTL